MTLIEVLAALVIVATVGLALVAALAGAVRGADRAWHEERATAEASRLLAAHTLLTGTDLDRRLGDRVAGEFLVRVARPDPVLYRIAVVERSTPGVELVVTVVHRPVAGPR